MIYSEKIGSESVGLDLLHLHTTSFQCPTAIYSETKLVRGLETQQPPIQKTTCSSPSRPRKAGAIGGALTGRPRPHAGENRVVVSQGEVWWADLPAPTGSGPGFRRPVVVVQSDALNQSRIATVVCVPLTSNLRWANVPGNVALPARLTGLPKDSVANVSQVITLDKELLTERVGKLPSTKLYSFDPFWTGHCPRKMIKAHEKGLVSGRAGVDDRSVSGPKCVLRLRTESSRTPSQICNIAQGRRAV